MRMNSEGIPRDDLPWALSRPDIVAEHRRVDRCLLCRSGNVNDAALCRLCYSMLNDQELVMALRWINGTQP